MERTQRSVSVEKSWKKNRLCTWAQSSPVMATALRTLERGWQWQDRQSSHYHQYEKAKIFLQPQKSGCWSIGLVGSNSWEWRLDPLQQYRLYRRLQSVHNAAARLVSGVTCLRRPSASTPFVWLCDLRSPTYTDHLRRSVFCRCSLLAHECGALYQPN